MRYEYIDNSRILVLDADGTTILYSTVRKDGWRRWSTGSRRTDIFTLAEAVKFVKENPIIDDYPIGTILVEGGVIEPHHPKPPRFLKVAPDSWYFYGGAEDTPTTSRVDKSIRVFTNQYIRGTTNYRKPA